MIPGAYITDGLGAGQAKWQYLNSGLLFPSADMVKLQIPVDGGRVLVDDAGPIGGGREAPPEQ